jgi:hypothetical protein
LTRETWQSAGAWLFGVDHVLPKSDPNYEKLTCEYNNLAYCCNACNSRKGVSRILDPCVVSLSNHLQIIETGEARSLSAEGERLIMKLKLNASEIVRGRAKIMRLHKLSIENPESETAKIFREYYACYPKDLPDLAGLQLSTNRKPEGVENSHLARRNRGELPDTY